MRNRGPYFVHVPRPPFPLSPIYKATNGYMHIPLATFTTAFCQPHILGLQQRLASVKLPCPSLVLVS